MNHIKIIKISLCLLSSIMLPSLISAKSLVDEELLLKGEYISILGDCMACHTTSKELPYAGGLVFKMPMGNIVASNITPSEQYGIGTWSEQEFADAVRKGVRPDGSYLYPAMPYPAFATITDEDIKALYYYFSQKVIAIETAPEQTTALNFPFNLPGLMPIWNALFVKNQPFIPNNHLTESENRGKYLVDGLTHCSTCHTPRNQFMAEDYNQYLSGGNANGWYAPNITPDKISGIGDWDKNEIISYLTTGRIEGKSYAAGPMAEAIDLSFQHLHTKDIVAIADYLQTIPASQDPAQEAPAYQFTQLIEIPITDFESYPATNNQSDDYRDASTTNGAILYNSVCATCHGIQGEGAIHKNIPSLTQNSTVGSANRTNLVMTIFEGGHRLDPDGKEVTLMPAYSEENNNIHSSLTHSQVVAISNYVTKNFGDGKAILTNEDIDIILQGGKQPFLIRHASALAISGAVIALFVLFYLIRFFVKKNHVTTQRK